MKSYLKKFREERGVVQIVEASFVFPITFIVLFFLIYMGNAFYLKSQVESVVEQKAIEGANYCADPILETIRKTGSVPTLSALKTEPYRYIFGGMNAIEKKIDSEVKDEIASNSFSFLKNMQPKLKGGQKISKFNNYVVYSTFSVDVEYSIKFPIRFIGGTEFSVLTIKTRAEMPVDDTAEFIRNTDMVMDLFSGTAKKISDVFGKINDFISSFASK